MKAEWGCVCAGDEPPGGYSTSTPLMLLPGTFGSAWSKTCVTLDSLTDESPAAALRKDRAAKPTPQRARATTVGIFAERFDVTAILNFFVIYAWIVLRAFACTTIGAWNLHAMVIMAHRLCEQAFCGGMP